MGVVVDFEGDLGAMLEELLETYDGRILSPQGKVVRVMPVGISKEEDGTWMFHGHVYITTLMGEEIYQAKLQMVPLVGEPVLEEKWREANHELEKLLSETEGKICEKGFLIKRGRYIFKGEAPHAVD